MSYGYFLLEDPPEPPEVSTDIGTPTGKGPRTGPNLVELAHAQYHAGMRSTSANATTTATQEA